MVVPEQVSDEDMVLMARDIAKTDRIRTGISGSDQGERNSGIKSFRLCSKAE